MKFDGRGVLIKAPLSFFMGIYVTQKLDIIKEIR